MSSRCESSDPDWADGGVASGANERCVWLIFDVNVHPWITILFANPKSIMFKVSL